MLTEYELMSETEKINFDNLTKDQELKNYIKRLKTLKSRINNKRNGTATGRAFCGFCIVLGMMGDYTKYLDIENVIDAELYNDMSYSRYSRKDRGFCYAGEAIQWLGNLPTSNGGYNGKDLERHVDIFDKIGGYDGMDAAVCVNTAKDIHRVTVTDMNWVINNLISDFKLGLKSKDFYNHMNGKFNFKGHYLS